MMWATADTEIIHPVSYLVDNDYVVPSSASATVRDLNGTVVHPATALDVTSTSAILTIPASATSIPAGQDYHVLFVSLSYIAAGRLHQQTFSISLVPFLPITTGPEEVRQVLGLPATELPDDQIRLHPAFFRLKNQVTGFEDILRSGTLRALQANRALALEAALELLPSLVVRIGQKMKSEDQEFTRGAIDWTALGLTLEGELQEILEELTDADPVVSIVNHFGWAIPTDPITGG